MVKDMKILNTERHILIDLNELRDKIYQCDDLQLVDAFARIIPELKRYEYVKTDYGFILKEA